MKITDVIDSEFILAQKRKDAKKSLSAFAPLLQKKYLIVFLCCFIYSDLFILLPGFSQSDSLAKYLEIAATNNPTVQQRYSEYKAALQKIPQAGSLPDPELNVGVYATLMNQIDGIQLADFRLMQMFPWFGVLKNAKDEMSLMAKAKFELFLDAQLQVSYDVQRTWYDLYKVQKEISISQQNIEILKTIERLALSKYKAPVTSNSTNTNTSPEPAISSVQTGGNSSSGMQTMAGGKVSEGSRSSNQESSPMQSSPMSSQGGSGLDIYQIQIETNELQNKIALLKNQQNTLIALFNSFLNRKSSSPVAAVINVVPDSLEIPVTQLADSISGRSPMLNMLEYEKESVEARKKMVTRMGYPMVGLGINYSIFGKADPAIGFPEMNGVDMIMPMVVVTLPIYRKKYKAMQEEAEQLKTATAQNYTATSNSLQVEYYQATQLYEDAQRRIKLYDSQYQLTSKSLDLTLGRFSVSASELSEVLRIQEQTLDYEYRQVEAVADFNISIAWLRRLSNTEILEKVGNK